MVTSLGKGESIMETAISIKETLNREKDRDLEPIRIINFQSLPKANGNPISCRGKAKSVSPSLIASGEPSISTLVKTMDHKRFSNRQ